MIVKSNFPDFRDLSVFLPEIIFIFSPLYSPTVKKSFFLHQGEERLSEVTGKPEPFYPDWKRNVFRYFVSLPVIIACLLVVFAIVFIILELQVPSYYCANPFSSKILCQYVVEEMTKSEIGGALLGETPTP